MREIKFRAWDLAGKKMTPTTLSSFDGDYHVNADCYLFDLVIMQYTGLKDKNGVEIYEGDIVRHWSYGFNDGGMGDKQVLSFVEWDEASACFENCVDRRRGVEVIGNIYENPELLND